ncbi:MAG TPA: (2Fe-2S)-binding protein [Haliea salexigens]|uniref:Bacterioferritin-associated ferredoxin n=1 Tax=Haliea salexigens TaxID=287487 RepID=A0A3C1KRT0_9GAMM|nr:(2Fe-2S)-binding protein [Haliea salexigens]MAA86037.1 (2Fe-2S)-binding protein [Haliea sp.]HAN29385.1 (2Fe-2S)-binding protein [Haliea salexigens]HAN68956.1 (2Fe-2S)-binding protein [Halieaceae bacterium]|tara:strand:- start:24411 stop:24623 length:213 start_codon:yes stop_codon:yes gene_type:complete
MFICLCRGVTDSEIRAEVRQGAVRYEDIQARLDVGMCCGTCKESAEEVIAESIAESLFFELKPAADAAWA